MKIRKYIYFPVNCFYCDTVINSKYEHSYDHIIPRAKGGKDTFENLLDCCKNCNQSKGDKSLKEWRLFLTAQIKGLDSNHPKFQHFNPIILRLNECLGE